MSGRWHHVSIRPCYFAEVGCKGRGSGGKGMCPRCYMAVYRRRKRSYTLNQAIGSRWDWWKSGQPHIPMIHHYRAKSGVE